MLAGGIAAAIAQRALSGHAAVVDVALLSASMWLMQRSITQATVEGVQRIPAPTRAQISNPLVNTYRTQDGRFVSLCMLQSQRYWPGFCRSEEHTSELQSLMRISYAVFCLKKKKKK